MMKNIMLLLGLISLFAWPSVPVIQGQDVAGDLLGRINQLRADQGLPGYSLNSALTAAARNQATWMANTGQVSHTQSDGSSVSDRAQAAGYGSSWVSENIYMGPLATVNSAWRFWLNSPIHYQGLTSPNYQHIGIASASGEGGKSFVLVFGNPGGRVAAAPRTNNSGNSSSAESSGPPPPPPYFKGVDAQGYLLHEIQPGDTMGDIALIYGYTWDDIPEILASNGLTPDDQRNLDVGEIIKVPPQNGTYTPTPADASETDNNNESESESAETTANATAPADDSGNPESNSSGSTDASPAPDTRSNIDDILPTPTADSSSPGMPATSTPQGGLVQPETYTQPTATLLPTLTATALPVTRAAMQIATVAPAASVTPLTVTQSRTAPETATASGSQTPPLWLILAIGIQVIVLGVASVEYVRRN